MEPTYIALLTDFGMRDPYVGVMKGVISSVSPHTPVIDITHEIHPQNISQAAFILGRSYHYFHTGTIFCVVVDPGVGGQRKALAVKTKNYCFVGPDNGVLSSALEKEEVMEMVEITNDRYILTPVSSTFHGRDVFAPAAAHISHGIPLRYLGPQTFHYQGLDFPGPEQGKFMIKGHVVYKDHFGNLVTDIEKNEIEGRTVSAIHFMGRELKRINQSYDESHPGELLAILGSFDTLEIAANQDSASRILGEPQRIPVEIWFEDEKVESKTLL